MVETQSVTKMTASAIALEADQDVPESNLSGLLAHGANTEQDAALDWPTAAISFEKAKICSCRARR